MKKTAPSSPGQPNRLRSEIKRDSIIVASLFVVVLLILGWKQLVMPPLSNAFSGTEHLAEVNNLLMIVGSLAILCLMLVVVLVAVVLKMQVISTKLDSLDGMSVPDETKDSRQTEGHVPPKEDGPTLL